jgi:hypothetical protein
LIERNNTAAENRYTETVPQIACGLHGHGVQDIAPIARLCELSTKTLKVSLRNVKGI